MVGVIRKAFGEHVGRIKINEDTLSTHYTFYGCVRSHL